MRASVRKIGKANSFRRDRSLTVFQAHGVANGWLGAVISLLLYLYFSAAVLLFGEELNAELRRNSPEGGETQGEAP